MGDTNVGAYQVRHRVAILLSLVLMAPAIVHGQTVTATWDPSPAVDQVTGYDVCVGTSSLSCNVALASVSASATTYTFGPAGGTLHYIAIRARNSVGASPYSSEVIFSIPSFAQPSNQSSVAGVAITPLNLSVVDPDGGPRTFTHTGLPTGLSLNSSTGQITGAPSAGGTYTVTVFVNDGLVTVWRSFTWTVTLGVSVVSSSPSSGSGVQQAFALQYSDLAGASDLATARVRFVSSTGSGPACTVNYDPSTGSARLQDDAATGWLPGTLGIGSVSNSQCSVNLANSSRTISGNALTLNLVVTFNASFAGAKSIMMLATSNGGVSTGWQQRGAWTVTAPSGGVPSTVSVAPGTGTGASGTFVMLYSNTVGATDLATARVRFVSSAVVGAGSAAGTCTATYDRLANSMSLQNDTGTSSQVGTLGSGTLSNSQCTINLASSFVSSNGNNLTLTVAVAFSASFEGAKNVYMRATTADNADTSWQLRGSWTVPASSGPGVPAVVSVTPGSGSGASGTFVMTYSDTAGAADLATAKVKFAPTSVGLSTGGGTCTVSYDPAGNSLSLMSDSGTTWLVGTLGSGTVSNSQCAVNLASSSASANGNNLTLTLAISFASGFAGAENIYMRATTDGGANTDWQLRGSWTVPPAQTASGTPSVNSVTPGSGSGRSANFVLQYSDTAGALDLATARVRFVAYSTSSGAGTGVNTCTVSYSPALGTVSLLDNAAAVWQSGAVGSGTLSNSQCTVNLANSSVAATGNSLRVTLAVTFTQSFNGFKRTYMLAKTLDGTSTGWLAKGTWRVQ